MDTYNPKSVDVFCSFLVVFLIVKFFLRPSQILSGLKGPLLISALGTCGVLFSWQCILGTTGKFEYIGPILLLSFVLLCFVVLVSSLHVVCSPPAIHILIIYLENCSISTLYFLRLVFLFRGQDNGPVPVPSYPTSSNNFICPSTIVLVPPHQHHVSGYRYKQKYCSFYFI